MVVVGRVVPALRPGLWTRSSGGLRLAAVLFSVMLAVAPVWLSPVLVTTDGPSHVYNAFLADAVRGGRPPFANYFVLAPGGLRPNQASEFLLAGLGRLLGWDIAERVVCTLAIVAMFAGLVRLLAVGPLALRLLLAPVAGWLAQGWFVWMGFYDFALSLACYAGLLLVLRRPPTPVRRLLLPVVFGALYLAHFLTFTVGAGIAVAALGARAVRRRERWVELAAAVPALLLVLVETASGEAGAGMFAWADPRRQLPGLVLGDFLMSLSPWDSLAGVAVMAAVWFAVAVRLWDQRRERIGGIGAAELFALGLLALSVVGPDQIGEGGFVAIRLRCLGVVTLLPVLAATLGRLGPRLLGCAAAVLSLSLVGHAAAGVQLGRAVDRELGVADRLLAQAGAAEGAWVARRFTGYRRTQYGIAARSHLLERIAVRRKLIVLDNYEALYQIFAVSWRRRPDWLTFAPAGAGLTVRLVPGEVRWPGAAYVLHEWNRGLEVADPRLELGRTVAESSFAVTPVRRP